jgi:hypothetical protein
MKSKIYLIKKTPAMLATILIGALAFLGLISSENGSLGTEIGFFHLSNAEIERAGSKLQALDSTESTLNEGNIQIYKSNIYYPDRPLGEQLPELRNLASKGNAHALCVLANALVSCAEEMMSSDPRKVEKLSSAQDVEKSNESQLVELSVKIEEIERLDFMCQDVTQADMMERDQWIFKSAMLGNPRSMAIFALNPIFSGNIQTEDAERMIAHRKLAESMLNRAAASGEKEAILGVYRAYSTGEISTSVGNLKVEKNAAKAAGAAKAMLPFVDGTMRIKLEEEISTLTSGMGSSQMMKMAASERSYLKAYRTYAAARTGVRSADANSPQAACPSRRLPLSLADRSRALSQK